MSIVEFHPPSSMAKSDSFFIRSRATSASAYVQKEIDLGSFVNLGVSKSTLLRVHNVSIQYADSTGPDYPIYSIAVPGGKVAWQLTTQTQTALVTADDKSLVSSGGLVVYGDSTSTAHPVAMSQDMDINPHNWTNGYLVGVDALYFAIDDTGTISSGTVEVSIILECTLETATQASSTALALSQQ